jgi:hypothetical protein
MLQRSAAGLSAFSVALLSVAGDGDGSLHVAGMLAACDFTGIVGH